MRHADVREHHVVDAEWPRRIGVLAWVAVVVVGVLWQRETLTHVPRRREAAERVRVHVPPGATWGDQPS